MAKTAVILGASGLVGNEVLEQLLADPYYDHVKILVRKILPLNNKKLEQVVVNFGDLKKEADRISGDVFFCCLGTTIKTAGSQAAFVKVDYTYVMDAAELAKKNGAERFIVISSIGVTQSGGNFYLSVKRDVENGLARLKFLSLIIVRPSMLLGARKEFRPAERIAKVFMTGLGFLFVGKLKKYKGIPAATVAKAMIALSKTELEGVSVFESDRLQQLGK